MRLTLRTLLAYLDDILEPAQAKEIGAKLNESSLASSLVSRIREVMRRRRLTAPTVSGPGVGIDPNAVAEYLDNTLVPDGVADVEKICLESDVHLAEVAACHQILTLALGEPVEVPSQTRSRMYALGPAAGRIASAAGPVGGRHVAVADELPSEALADVLKQAEALTGNRRAGPAARPVPLPGATPEVRTQLPDYLRRGPGWKRLAAWGAAVAVLVVWGALVIQRSPFQKDRPAQSPVRGDAQIAATDAGAGSREDDPQSDPVPEFAPDQGEPAAGAAEPPGRQVAAASRNTGTPRSDADSPVKDETEDAGTARSRPTASVAPDEIDFPAPPEEPEDGTPPFRRRTSDANATRQVVEELDPPAAASEKPDATDETAPEPPPVQVQPARYASVEGVTLHYVRQEGRWFVLPRRAQVLPGDALAAPEPFDCALELGTGDGSLTLTGRAALRWLDPQEDAPTSVALYRGQMVVRALSQSGDDPQPLRMGIAIAGELWRLALRPGTACGIELIPREPARFEQPPEAPGISGGIYVAAGGQATVTDPQGTEIAIAGPGWLKLPAEGANPPLVVMPQWMSAQKAATAEKTMSRQFEKKFNLDEAVELSLPAVADDRNAILSRLAAECLGLIDAYGPLVNVLHRAKQHDETRRAAIAALRVWLPQAPENRTLLKEELARLYAPEDAAAVYRLLWGFDAADARDRTKSLELLDWMESPEVSIRELAFGHVHRLTGKTHEYRPSNPSPAARQAALRSWRAAVQKDGALLPPARGESGK